MEVDILRNADVELSPCHRMKEGQEAIYYMAADSKLAAESAPFVEQLVKRDFEVPACSKLFTQLS